VGRRTIHIAQYMGVSDIGGAAGRVRQSKTTSVASDQNVVEF
jgi:hypothetical protein